MILAFLATAWAGCLERPVVPEEPGAESSTQPCAELDLRMSGRTLVRSPAVGVSRGFDFPEPRASFGIRLPGDVSSRLALVPFGTGGTAGYLGVRGEAFVPTVQIGEARWSWKQAGLAVAAGLVDDPWTVHELRVWSLPTVALGMGQSEEWMARSDLGGWVAWTAPGRVLTATLGLANGEGGFRRDRNNGVNLAVHLIGRPLSGEDDLEIALYAREGSRGLLSARDHRAGLMVSGGPDIAYFGGQALIGWGHEADATLTPGGVSVFARTDNVPVLGFVRADHVRAVRSDPNSGTTILRAGGGPRLPWTQEGASPAWLAIGGEVRRPGSNAGPTAGQPVTELTGYLQLTATVRGSWTLEEAQ